MTTGIYQHFKGGLYLLRHVAQHSEDASEYVVYQNIQTGKWWVRPRSMWDEHVEKDGYSGPRFKLIRKIRYGIVPTDELLK